MTDVADVLAPRWERHDDAQELVDGLLARAVEGSAGLRAWAERLHRRTATTVPDWLDHVAAPVDARALAATGFAPDDVSGTWRHPGAQLAAVLPVADGRAVRVAVRVDDADAFAAATPGSCAPRGRPLSALRTAEVSLDGGVTLVGVERRSWSAGVHPTGDADEGPDPAVAAALQAFRGRERGGEPASAYARLRRDVAAAVDAAGVDVAAALLAQAERELWEARNTAGRWQRARQDELGLGWGNADHHTFRSSREGFAPLLEVLHALGFHDREKFHAGEAGWGAQVLEQPGAGVVVFADVDAGVEELPADWADGLPPRDELRTVGLWCAMFGDSLLEAGMHHLEGQFDFDALRRDLVDAGVEVLPPFSDLPHLRQAFTEAERWPVPADRLEALVGAGHLSGEKAEELARRGAPGSHLEDLQRAGGFKGFNQRSVSDIIARTDARVYAGR